MSKHNPAKQMLSGEPEFHRDTRTGYVIPLSAVHVENMTPTMQKELKESSEYRSAHTNRIQVCLQTQIINFFKGPGASFSFFTPDTSVVIDLGSLRVLDKPSSIKDWSRDGWAFRWDTESIRKQLGYNKSLAATIDLDNVIYNFFTKLKFVWMPKSNDQEPARIDPFTNFNNIKIIPTIDAAYFNISSSFLQEYINDDKANYLYHRQIRSKLRSETALQIATILLKDWDLTPDNKKIKQTSFYDQKFYVDQLYQGGKKLYAEDKSHCLQWASFVKDYITAHLPKLRSAFGFKSLKFVTNKKHGKEMLGWFEFTWPDAGTGSVPLIANAKDIPQLAHPDLFTDQEAAKFTTAVNPKEHFSWEAILETPEFIEAIYQVLDTLDIDRSKLNQIVIAYSHNAANQIPKSLKRWLRPLSTWLKNRQDQYQSTKPESDDLIDFDTVARITPDQDQHRSTQKKHKVTKAKHKN